MIARSSVLYALAPTTMEIVAIIGALTAVYAASMGLVQNGIKKVVTGVGFLIHIYSIGYMHGDRGFARFFAYLNLFNLFNFCSEDDPQDN